MNDIQVADVHKQFADFFPEEKLRGYFYLLSKRLSEGNICVPFEDFNSTEIPEEYVLFSKASELSKQSLVTDADGRQPIILHQDKVYLHRYFRYETIIVEKIKSFIANENSVVDHAEKLMQLKSYINELFDTKDTEPNWQFAAAISAILNQFSIITGGPGTGKTTTIAKTLAILFKINPAIKIALAAPTGKAANRMAESLKFAANKFSNEIQLQFETLVPSTIHRLLGVKRNSVHFIKNADDQLAYDVIIVDETSMMDAALLAKFFEAVAPDAKLIFLGDKNQLSAVEAGSIFGDLCEALPRLNVFNQDRNECLNTLSENKTKLFNELPTREEQQYPLFGHIVSLTKSYRFKDGEGIGALSKAILNNDVPAIKHFLTAKDSQVEIMLAENDAALEKFVLKYAAYINEPDISKALSLLNNQKILCATKMGKRGVHDMNRQVENILQKNQMIKVTGAFYHNMPVMISENNYQLELYNGDVGLVREEKGELRVWFENSKGLISFIPAYISSANKNFAMTIHKSQGSEYKEVWISLPENDEDGHYTRELLYTAITRAKEKVFIHGSEEMILTMASRKLKRSSGVVERLQTKN